MTTAKPPARYSAMESARSGDFATPELHHPSGHDPGNALCLPTPHPQVLLAPTATIWTGSAAAGLHAIGRRTTTNAPTNLRLMAIDSTPKAQCTSSNASPPSGPSMDSGPPLAASSTPSPRPNAPITSPPPATMRRDRIRQVHVLLGARHRRIGEVLLLCRLPMDLRHLSAVGEKLAVARNAGPIGLDHHRIGEDHGDQPVVLTGRNNLPAFVSPERGELEPARHLHGVLIVLGKGDASEDGERNATHQSHGFGELHGAILRRLQADRAA